ncbi:MAG: DUF2330 domain-containing protein [Dehalococcoidia bacterium]
MRRILIAAFALAALSAASLTTTTSSANACAGLIGSNGAVNLGRTTTLAAYHDGTEHYVTSFEFQGGGGEFGTLIPLPDVPTKVEKGGAWTLQRLQQETQLEFLQARSLALADTAAGSPAEVILEAKIDALDITVLKGGGPAVAEWATQHGFRLSPDAPEVLDFYAERSPIFLAAVFDGDAANERGQALGDGTPVHITIPTDNPWVPLRILGLGKQADDFVEADVFLLTDEEPELLPGPRRGMVVTHSDAATDLLLDDLRSDENSDWIPESAWLTKLSINSRAKDLKYDLAVDATGNGTPSRIAAGLDRPPADQVPTLPLAVEPRGDGPNALAWAAGAGAVVLLLAVPALWVRSASRNGRGA